MYLYAFLNGVNKELKIKIIIIFKHIHTILTLHHNTANSIFVISVWVILNVPNVITNKGCETGTTVCTSLSEKTRKSRYNNLQKAVLECDIFLFFDLFALHVQSK